MNKLTDLPNIGPELEKQLNDIGIYTKDDLEAIGSKDAWLKIKEMDSSACINRLMSLEGAIQGVRWHNLDISDKEELKKFYNSNKI